MRFKKIALVLALLMLTGCNTETESAVSTQVSEIASVDEGTGIDELEQAEKTTKATTQEPEPVVVEPKDKAKITDGNVGFLLNDGDMIATFTIAGYGTVKAKLFPKIAPVGVSNFVSLVNKGTYNGLELTGDYDYTVIFPENRVMCMAQGIAPDVKGTEELKGGFEIEANEFARNFNGALCYHSAYGSNKASFFIVDQPNSVDYYGKVNRSFAQCSAAIYADNANQKDITDEKRDYYRYTAVSYVRMLNMMESPSASDAVAAYLTKGGCPELDGFCTVFGQVYEGIDIISAVNKACSEEHEAWKEYNDYLEDVAEWQRWKNRLLLSGTEVLDYDAAVEAKKPEEVKKPKELKIILTSVEISEYKE